ncbi:hypothetical protein [Ralstonia sp. A12]|uniref:hypothetical protein n=1 Tax=Ralstonia sp. A12 TaxID=1217052 RepID=UPI000694E22D|nr:hypothetical protein [Ralstonia sp. A12]
MADRGLVVLIAVFTPLALLGIISSPNEYQAMGSGGIDCDGPIEVLLFAVPALVVYLLGLARVMAKAWRNRQTKNVVAATACLVVCAGLMVNIALACGYYLDTEHRMVCGPGL